MAELKQIPVPDIGDFKDVNVIEVLVKAGDQVQAEQSLITLETDKATMDVPSPFAGVVKEVKIKAGDKVSQGSMIALVETSEETAAKSITPASAANAVSALLRKPLRQRYGLTPLMEPLAKSLVMTRGGLGRGWRTPAPRSAASRASSASILFKSKAVAKRDASPRTMCRISSRPRWRSRAAQVA